VHLIHKFRISSQVSFPVQDGPITYCLALRFDAFINNLMREHDVWNSRHLTPIIYCTITRKSTVDGVVGLDKHDSVMESMVCLTASL
jgi:hypothetical protein